jgi:hypothetical protein
VPQIVIDDVAVADIRWELALVNDRPFRDFPATDGTALSLVIFVPPETQLTADVLLPDGASSFSGQ